MFAEEDAVEGEGDDGVVAHPGWEEAGSYGGMTQFGMFWELSESWGGDSGMRGQGAGLSCLGGRKRVFGDGSAWSIDVGGRG